MARLSRQAVALVVSAALLLLTRPASAAVTPQQVQEAIDKAQKYLYSQQKNGNWEQSPAPVDPTDPKNVAVVTGLQWGGLTALASLALIASGEDPTDPQLEPAIKFIVPAELKGIYVLVIRSQLLALLPQKKDVRDQEIKDGTMLLGMMSQASDSKGFYSYGGASPFYHHSPSQFAVLGMWQLSEAGLDVPPTYWQTIDKAWRGTQCPDGGWPYSLKAYPTSGTTESMTAAGVATLFVTDTMLSAGIPQTDCNTPPQPDLALERGIKFLGDNFAKADSAYTWYGLERIGLAGGRRQIGGNDWFQKGAELLISKQGPDGQLHMAYGGVIDTSFMLLFLSRGGAPIVMQKLQYPAPDPEGGAPGSGNFLWNQRPRDAANVVNWIGRQCESTLSWQSIDISEPVEDFHDAPILYISGAGVPTFSTADKAKLRQYVEEGGMIVGNSNCDKERFSHWFSKLGTELFPQYEMRPLPPKHQLLIGEQFPFKGARPRVSGLSNSVRELMILLDGDPSAAWQSQEKQTKRVSFEIASDLYQYACGGTGAHRRLRGETYFVRPTDGIQSTSQLKMARIKYEGNWDPEPAGWKRLAAILLNTKQFKLDIDTVALGKDDLSRYKFAHLTGTAKYQFKPAELAALKAYVKGGGTLLIDAAGGSGEFTTAITDQLRTLFATELGVAPELPVLAADDPLYTTGGDLAVLYRPYAIASGRRRKGSDPHLRCITVDNRKAIYFSEDDLGSALVGATADGITGFDPATAVDLTSRIVMSVAGR